MKKTLFYILIGIPLLLLLLGGLFLGYTYFTMSSTLPKNTNIEQAHTPEDTYNVYLQTGNNTYSQSTKTGITLEEKIPLLEESINNYSDALSLFSNEYAAKNLEFVQEQLRITKLELQKQQQEQQKSEEQNGEPKDGEQSGETSSQNTNKPSPQPSSKGEEEAQEEGAKEEDGGDQVGKSGEESSKSESGEQSENSEEKGLSEETKKILEEKAKELEEQQGDIGQFYNKNYKENNSRSPFDNFADVFGKDPFFDNSLLDENEEKDW